MLEDLNATATNLVQSMAVAQDLVLSKKYATQFEISVEESSRRREENAAHWKIRGMPRN